MKAYISQNLIGVFAFDENGKLLDLELFPRDPRKVVEKISEISLTDEEKKLIDRLRKEGYNVFISSKNTAPYQYQFNNLGDKILRKKFREILNEKLGIGDVELNDLLSKISLELTRRKIKKSIGKDKIVIQVIDAIDEINKSLNTFSARLREWYSLHFPEMDDEIKEHEKYAKIVSEFGLRDNIKEGKLAQLKEKSMGIDLNEEDGEILRGYATRLRELFKLRDKLENYIDKLLKEVAPNLRGIAGPLLAARLIALAGGLDKLAKKPSSTIQLLGAEKALFRFLHGRGKSPKHGVIFMHPYVQKAPPKKRGKIARILASKLSIAAKLDYYGKEDRSKELKEDLEERVKNILKE